jgi:copper chaperone CopZ
MKLLILILSFFLTTTTFSQMQKQQWVTIKSVNLKCWECKESLEKYLAKANQSVLQSGITQMKFNLLQGEIKIQFWPDRCDIETIRATINNAGFDADTEKAEPEAYKKIPPICKYAEEGGGPQPKKPCHIPPIN